MSSSVHVHKEESELTLRSRDTLTSTLKSKPLFPTHLYLLDNSISKFLFLGTADFSGSGRVSSEERLCRFLFCVSSFSGNVSVLTTGSYDTAA